MSLLLRLMSKEVTKVGINHESNRVDEARDANGQWDDRTWEVA